MPELPEVETTRRGISSHVCEHPIVDVTIRQPHLRWPVPDNLQQLLVGHSFQSVERRGKYLLLSTGHGTLIIHLGMSGSLRILPADTKPEKHDHVDIIFRNSSVLRLRDPRRFGAVLWTDSEPAQHKLLDHLGIEPLSRAFCGKYLHEKARKRKVDIKQFIMNSHIVVGVGNIYASEALFLSGIRPTSAAYKISLPRMNKLAEAIQTVLRKAIKKGGTSLRDFTRSDGKPGYFRQSLNVYGREGEPCNNCGSIIRLIRQGQRATYYCGKCQK
jgi:formamidopyrimidine-DNA glycosylase